VRSETLEGRRWIGRVLRDRWRIDARISRGGVGTVYAATHKNNGSRAAIKVLHVEFSRDADTRSRFLQEGYAANQVNHPGVVRILDDDTSEDGHAYLVMELLEGELLETRRVRKGGRLPLPDVYEVGEQLLDVLAAAHEKGIVHRDIKPDNLFITQEGRLKVLDFGFAQMKSSFRTEQTATGFLLGTPGFMSPEQAVGNRPQIDAQTDIWAVGATLFQLISGEAVHAGESAAEMLVAAANFPPRSLATVTTGLNPRLVHLVDKAVAFEKKNRWPNARAMQFALREVSGKQSAGQVSRRSIPDDGRSFWELNPQDEATDIEELESSELEDAKASWGSAAGERTVIAHGDMPDAAIPSAITRPVTAPGPRSHPADEDDPTLAVPSATTDPSELAPPRTEPPTAYYPSTDKRGGTVEAHNDTGTLIMESPASAHDPGIAYPPISNAPTSGPKAYAGTIPYPQAHDPHHQHAHHPYPPQPQQQHQLQPQTPQAFRTTEGDLGYAAPAAATGRQAQMAAPGSNRVLVFIGVVVVTMVVVIAAGLVILGMSD
jgi:serine/threonine protein kinase